MQLILDFLNWYLQFYPYSNKTLYSLQHQTGAQSTTTRLPELAKSWDETAVVNISEQS